MSKKTTSLSRVDQRWQENRQVSWLGFLSHLTPSQVTPVALCKVDPPHSGGTAPDSHRTSLLPLLRGLLFPKLFTCLYFSSLCRPLNPAIFKNKNQKSAFLPLPLDTIPEGFDSPQLAEKPYRGLAKHEVNKLQFGPGIVRKKVCPAYSFLL